MLISQDIKNSKIERAKTVNANFIVAQSLKYLTSEDFLAESFGEKEKVFTKFFENVDTDEIVRIKVWSKEGTIIYSDKKTIVGQNFNDNPSFQEAIRGETTAEIKEPIKPENVSELGYEQLMEVYVPISLSSNGIDGVIETYSKLDSVNASIAKSSVTVFSIAAVTATAIIVVLFFLFMFLKKDVIIPVLNLRDAADEITKGNLDKKLDVRGPDEITELAAAFNSMTDSIKKNIELEKELAISQQDLRNEKLTTVGLLASRLAHDLRNPLSVIKNTLELLEAESMQRNDKNEKKKFDRLNRAIARMLHQIDDVMEFVRMKPLKLESASMYEIVKSTVQLIKKPENIAINLPTNDLHILCDTTRLEVVFTNILLNAIQAIGEEKGTITIRFKEKTDSARIEIEDTGFGVSPDIANKIFDPLFTTKQSGTGLGLSGCKNIIEQHGGTINVKNNPSTFIIILPKQHIEIENQNNKKNSIMYSSV